MAGLGDLLQSADWKSEKHIPVIEAPDKVNKGEFFKVTVGVGKGIPHPNKTEHFISWISVFFQPQGDKYPYQVAKAEFSAHGASINGPDTSAVYAHPEMAVTFKTDKPGMIFASSYCNIHGLWQASRELALA
ncbi:MAG: class II SORL domain-containing protein [Candidatus Omnitrophota bacterium]